MFRLICVTIKECITQEKSTQETLLKDVNYTRCGSSCQCYMAVKPGP
jgi:hypothetical protein